MTVRRLIEEELPLKAVNAESAREKSLRHGHISTMHLWWARRPLADEPCRRIRRRCYPIRPTTPGATRSST